MSREAMKQPEALRLADALDDEFVQGRISNHNGRKAAAELRRLHEVNQDLLKALHEALETEQKSAVSPGKGTGFNYFRASPITVLRLPQEPVAWISDSPTKGNGKQLHWTKSEAWRWSSNITPLYTAPPKREWVGVMVHSNELQAILDYVEDMEQRISIVRDQLQYLLAESAESDEESDK